MLNFANASGYTGGIIPAGTLIEGQIAVEELRQSEAGNDYLNLRVDITAPEQFAGRKVWMNLTLTQDGGKAPSGVGYSQVKAVLETNGADPGTDPQRFQFPDFASVAGALNGSTIAARLGAEDTRDGGQRNNVKLVLSPNPASNTRGLWEKLQADLGRSAAAWPGPANRPRPSPRARGYCLVAVMVPLPCRFRCRHAGGVSKDAIRPARPTTAQPRSRRPVRILCG